MKNKSKANILVTFIILVAMSMMLFSFLSFITVRLKDSTFKASEIESFYVADAGLNKAIWYLGTSTGQGGRGFDWRTTSSVEAFGWGRFYMTVASTAVSDEVQIISTGEVSGIRKTTSIKVRIGGLPAAFDYAIFNNSALSLSGNAAINGDVYVNGNTTFSGNCDVMDGYVYHSSGSTVTGNGTYTDGGTPTPVPTLPVFDTSYYTDLITTALSQPEGDVSYSNTTVNLNGGTIYINGDLLVSGNVTINGPGQVVATGTISISGNTYSSNDVKFIAGGATTLSGNAYTDGAIYYSDTSLTASGNTRVNVGGFFSSGSMTISGNLNISGLMYASGQITLAGNPVITGSIVSGSASGVTGLSGNATITFDDSVFPTSLPPGFTPTELELIRGTWKGT